ncbi:hypothetical protein BC830DRAFT_1222363 [Chytriomyces sp. MP71]|nr:hypothetical protein BC830DRAFT_1222363 [Chytriomyces sp. MP71]
MTISRKLTIQFKGCGFSDLRSSPDADGDADTACMASTASTIARYTSNCDAWSGMTLWAGSEGDGGWDCRLRSGDAATLTATTGVSVKRPCQWDVTWCFQTILYKSRHMLSRG